MASRLSRSARGCAGRAVEMVRGVSCHLGDLRISPTGEADRLLRIALFPAGDADVASTRLRSLPLLGAFEPTSRRSVRGEPSILRGSPRVAWIQKRLTDEHLRIARRLKSEGSFVVYDCDDTGSDLEYWSETAVVREMLLLADVVTTDTPERGELLREIEPSCRIRVIENQADYTDRPFPVDPSVVADPPDALRVLWFGNTEHIASLAPYRSALAAVDGVRLLLCGARPADARRALGRVPFEIHAWSRTRFAELLRACDLTLLSHSGSRHDRAKSAHKMVTSIYHGVPALVSDTPDYRRVAALAGVADDAVFDSAERLGMALERMKSAEARHAFIDRARPVLAGRYGPGSLLASAIRLLSDSFAGSTELRRPAAAG